MDVGVNLHDLRGSGRLGALARALGVNELEALGTVTVVWAETQHRELITVTEESFCEAVSLHFDEPRTVLLAMVRARLMSVADSDGRWLIHGNDKHVAKLQAFRSNAARGGKAKAAKRQTFGTGFDEKRLADGKRSEPKRHENTTEIVPSGSQARALVTGILDTGNRDLTSDTDLSQVQDQTSDPRSSLSSDAKNALSLSASPSADADPEKRKRRSSEQQERSKANNRLYRELYENAEGHPPAGLDQAFNGMMAKFSDKYGDDAEHILRWVFATPDKSFRNKGWPLPLIIQQAPRLWRELNDPKRAVENLAQPRQQQKLSLAASNELEFAEFLARHGEAPAHAR